MNIERNECGAADGRGGEGGEPGSGGCSRRRFLSASGMVFAGLTLAGCAGRRVSSADDLPGPKWEPDPASGPNTRPPSPIAGGSSQPAPVPAPPPGYYSEPVGVLPRSAWTTAGVARPREVYPMGPILRITVHHEGMTNAGIGTQGQAAARLEAIRRYHTQSRGWADIGYHYVIDPQGRVWQGRSVGYQGAHVKDSNENNLGVMLIGNFDQQQPSPQAMASLDRFVAAQMARYRVPINRVYTHQEIKSTACPGRSLQRYMLQTRSNTGMLASLARRGSGLG
ncbi:MAG: N-acetylmuramoyl-L-alanine amidase [Phycisphaerae bacterium]|nr:N-acetylmuramoyl-L-alanine amidase [Phycisphaerae bacterium]